MCYLEDIRNVDEEISTLAEATRNTTTQRFDVYYYLSRGELKEHLKIGVEGLISPHVLEYARQEHGELYMQYLKYNETVIDEQLRKSKAFTRKITKHSASYCVVTNPDYLEHPILLVHRDRSHYKKSR